ncbi:MAG TPA: hypothetical protein PLX80_14745 [Ignavibacteria bacterium]|nr:hypothetical protein [Ignavibacteria bacterium]
MIPVFVEVSELPNITLLSSSLENTSSNVSGRFRFKKLFNGYSISNSKFLTFFNNFPPTFTVASPISDVSSTSVSVTFP